MSARTSTADAAAAGRRFLQIAVGRPLPTWAATGWQIVVSGGSVNDISGESSNPITETFPGYRQAPGPSGPHGSQCHQIGTTDNGGGTVC